MKKNKPLPTAAEPAATLPLPPHRVASILWTDNETAEFLSVEPRTLRLWRRTRGLPFIRITSKAIASPSPRIRMRVIESCEADFHQ